MKVVELLKIGRELLKVMSKTDVRRDDWKYIEAYEHFKMMRINGVKHTEAIRMLSQENNVSERTFERAIKRLEAEC